MSEITKSLILVIFQRRPRKCSTAIFIFAATFTGQNDFPTRKFCEQKIKLTYLYVINNKLTELASITKLTKLEKLYAGGNNIQVTRKMPGPQNGQKTAQEIDH